MTETPDLVLYCLGHILRKHHASFGWPDTLSLATNGYLYVTTNQLHRHARFNKEGRDLRRKPYSLFLVDAQPVLLR